MLVLRVTAGLVFAVHGWAKLGDVGSTAQFMGSAVGFGGTFWAWFVGLIELIGGVALVLGVYTKLMAKILAINILVALLLVHLKMPWAQAELPLVLLGSMLALGACGAGKWRLTKKECCCGEDSCMSEQKKCACPPGACTCGDKKEGDHCGTGHCA